MYSRVLNTSLTTSLGISVNCHFFETTLFSAFRGTMLQNFAKLILLSLAKRSCFQGVQNGNVG